MFLSRYLSRGFLTEGGFNIRSAERLINTLNVRGNPRVVATADEAVAQIRSFDKLYLHGVAAVPHGLVEALMRRSGQVEGVEIYHLHTEGPAPYVDPAMSKSFGLTSFFVGKNVRAATQKGEADYLPVFLSEVSSLFRTHIPLDACLITVSPPDRHGFCSLGTSVDVTLAAARSSRMVIAQVNKHMPRTQGAGIIHMNSLDVLYYEDRPLPEHKKSVITPQIDAIATNVARLVEDGACLQMGIGAIPDAVLKKLHSHRNLGIHTEMMAEGVIDLIESGVINGSQKKVLPGKVVTSFLMGTRRMYDFVDDNPHIHFAESSYVNNSEIIASNPKATAINSCLEIDLTGQICADSLGSRIYSGVGGQMDFIRGASLSQDGKPIIALPSVTSRGESRIVPYLKTGAGVVTTRAHVHWVVTEHGAVDLFGLPIRKRQKALISIAHPNHRAALEDAVEAQYKALRDAPGGKAAAASEE